MSQKRYNPYRVKTEEVAKFRGITDIAELHNAGESYASGMSNVESFKIRALSQRSGQSKDSAYDKPIREGGSFVSLRGIAVGGELRAEPKSFSYGTRPSKLPWSRVVAPLVLDGFDLPKVTYTCKDIDLPDIVGVSRRDGYDNTIINETNYLECFIMTCSDLWELLSDEELVCRVPIPENADLEINLATGFGDCYQPTKCITSLPEEPSISPYIPWVPSNPSDEQWYDNLDCEDEVISFDLTPDDSIVITLIEGYSDETFDVLMSATIESRTKWADACECVVEMVSGVYNVSTTRDQSNTSDFLCMTTGTIKLKSFIEDGLPAGTILKGTVKSRALGERKSIPIAIYVAKEKFIIPVSANYTKTEVSKSFFHSTGGFPDANDFIDPFLALSYDTLNGSESGVDTIYNYSWHQGGSLPTRSDFRSGTLKSEGFNQDYTIPGSGIDISGVFIWKQDSYRSPNKFLTDLMLTQYDRVFHNTTSWFWQGDDVPITTREATVGLAGASQSAHRLYERIGVYSPGSLTNLTFDGAPSDLQEPPASLDTGECPVMSSRNTVSNLLFLRMS